MQIQDQLQVVAAQFAQWRQNKDTLGIRTPNTLRQQAVQLTQHYSVSKIVTTLGLSGSIFKRWQATFIDTTAASPPVDTQFVSLPEPVSISPSLSLRFDNGSGVDISADTPKEMVLRIVQACWE